MPKPRIITLGDETEIPVLYEDRSVLAIDKPAGWLLVPSWWDMTGRNLQLALDSSLQARDFWAASRNLRFLRFVHRLDAETSGVLLLVKSRGAVSAYSELFESREVQKLYLAVVAGNPREDQWSCRLAIEPDPQVRGKMRVSKSQGKSSRVTADTSKTAETHFQVIARQEKQALVAARPHTGRTHQIRVHLAAAGYPVLDDPLYSMTPSTGPRTSKNSGMALRAIGLQYRDPFIKKNVRIEAPCESFIKKRGFTVKHEQVFAGFFLAAQKKSNDSK